MIKKCINILNIKENLYIKKHNQCDENIIIKDEKYV